MSSSYCFCLQGLAAEVCAPLACLLSSMEPRWHAWSCPLDLSPQRMWEELVARKQTGIIKA